MTAAAWKTSAGAAARIPIARATNLNRTLRAYADAGLQPDRPRRRRRHRDRGLADASGPLVLVVGSEGAGLSRLVREACDTLAAIPISASVESLNAGVAAGIALYEIARIRWLTGQLRTLRLSVGRSRGLVLPTERLDALRAKRASFSASS